VCVCVFDTEHLLIAQAVHVCMCACFCVCVSVCVRVCVCVCVCVCVRVFEYRLLTAQAVCMSKSKYVSNLRDKRNVHQVKAPQLILISWQKEVDLNQVQLLSIHTITSMGWL